MANETSGNSQAFASIAVEKDGLYGGPGLTKREYFAAIALQGMLANHYYNRPRDRAATWAVEYADALILELNK